VTWPVPELAAGVMAGVLRLPEELVPEELLLDELPPEEVLPEVPELVDLEADEPADCELCATFGDEEATEAPAAPGRL
jgi:hypothetical protein